MFLLVCVRHVGAHQDELQHGVSIQSSINLGKTFPRISRIRIIPSTQILARVFVYLPPFISQILDFICRMVLIFIFDLFWMAWHWKPAIIRGLQMWFSYVNTVGQNYPKNVACVLNLVIRISLVFCYLLSKLARCTTINDRKLFLDFFSLKYKL